MAEWRDTTLGDFVTLQRGFDLPSQRRRPGPHAVLGSNGPVGTHDEAPVRGPGMVIGRAANLGRPTWSEKDFWPLNTTLFVKDYRGNDPRFTYYLFHGLDLAGYDSGSVQPMLNRNYITGVQITVPPPSEQRAIAGVLGALDDKVALNARLVARSRDLARFELGAARRDLVARVGDIAEIRRGIAYTSAGLGGGGLPMVNLANADDHGWLKRAGLKMYSGSHKDRHLARPGALLVAGVEQTWSNEILGWPMLVPPDLGLALFSQDLFLIDFHPDFAWSRLPVWSALFDAESRAFLEGHIYGSTIARIPREAFENLVVRLPQPNDAAIELADVLLGRAWSAEVEALRLLEMRDALLRPLLSGRLRTNESDWPTGVWS